MKISQTQIIPYQPLSTTLASAMKHVESAAVYPDDVKSATKAVVDNIQLSYKPFYGIGIYGAKTEDVKSSIIEKLKDIKHDFGEKPWLAALKSLGIGLQLTGIGKAIYKGEFGTSELKDITGMVGLTIVSNATISFPPTDILGIANLIVEKATDLLEKSKAI